MNNRDNYLDYEEDFHRLMHKEHKQDRKALQKKDRSKYKKTDQEKKTSQLTPEKGQLEGRVISITSEGIYVLANNESYLCSLKGSFKKEKTKQKNLVTVGDEVFIEPSVHGEGVVAAIKPRKSLLARLDNLSRRKMQFIASNVDLVFIVISIHSPRLKPPLVDRYLIAAQKGGMQGAIVVNKMDLIDQLSIEERDEYQAFIDAYKELNYPLFLVSAKEEKGLDELKQAMLNKTSVFSGQSGVGKTSLINKLLNMDLSVGDVVRKTKKGSHTTTIARLIPLEKGGYVVDTPGIKSFGVWDMQPDELAQFYPEILKYSPECRFPNCRHVSEPGCAVLEAVDEGKISILRYTSYLNLLEEKNIQEWE